MDWIEIVLKIPVREIDRVAAIANMTVSYGIFIEDYSDLETGSWEVAHVDLIDESLLAKNRMVSLIHIYFNGKNNVIEALAYLKERLQAEDISFEVSSADVAEIDWNEYWKKFFHITEIGDHLAVIPVWEKYNGDRVPLIINPGAAFGTGTHATTSLCLELLESHCQKDISVLDIGCGSGILAIASVLLGAEKAIGVDIDELAVKVAKENAVMNGVNDRTDFLVGDLADKVTGRFDFVCANIVADVILRLFSTVGNYMNDDGYLLISGIIDTRAEDVLDGIHKNGFFVINQLYRDNWCAFLLKKKGNE